MPNDSAQSCGRKRMNASKLSLLAGLFAIITAGFSPAQVTPTTATGERDPIKSFKELVTRFPKGSIGKSGETTYDIVDVTFDVKKTDSLINPIIGTINFTTKLTMPNPPQVQKMLGEKNHTNYVPMEMVFHWQGDHWKFERLVDPRDGSDLTGAAMDGGWGGAMAEFLKSVQ